MSDDIFGQLSEIVEAAMPLEFERKARELLVEAEEWVGRLLREKHALEEALELYGSHLDECPYQPVYDIPCKCGLDAALSGKG